MAKYFFVGGKHGEILAGILSEYIESGQPGATADARTALHKIQKAQDKRVPTAKLTEDEMKQLLNAFEGYTSEYPWAPIEKSVSEHRGSRIVHKPTPYPSIDWKEDD